MNNKICKCGNSIPKARLDLCYTQCVSCSTVEKFGCIDTINHKTGNTIQIMSRHDANQASKLTQRAGFGTLRAITKGSSQRKTKYQYDGCSTSQIGSNELYEHVGKTYIDYLDVDKNIAERYLTRSLANFEISELQYNKIKQITKLIW